MLTYGSCTAYVSPFATPAALGYKKNFGKGINGAGAKIPLDNSRLTVANECQVNIGLGSSALSLTHDQTIITFVDGKVEHE